MRKITEHSKRPSLLTMMLNQPWSEELVLQLGSLLWRLRRERRGPVSFDPSSHGITNGTEALPNSGPKSVDTAVDTTRNFARCFLRLANLPNFTLDRLGQYETTLWRQADQILLTLDVLDRRKPQDRGRCLE